MGSDDSANEQISPDLIVDVKEKNLHQVKKISDSFSVYITIQDVK
jgi:hypothetical protein